MGKPRDLANVVATGNILADGAVAPAELTGVTSTAAEINILDGVTATAAELNIMDGVTATTAELNHVDGVTSNVQTQMDTKAPVADPTFTGTVTGPTINASTALQIGGTAITATAAELNKMDGVTVSASDINSVTAKAPTADPTFTGTLAAPTVNASTKLQVNGTDVITNARQLSNIASVDATTAAAITTAGVGGANSFDATASGALANGDPVILNANGTVSKPAVTQSVNDPATLGYTNATLFNSQGTSSVSAAYNSASSGNGKGAFMIVFKDTSDGNQFKGNTMTIRSDGELNVEGEFTIDSVQAQNDDDADIVYDPNQNKFLVVYTRGTYMDVKVRRLEGDNASNPRSYSVGAFSTIAQVSSGEGHRRPRIATNGSGGFVCIYSKGSGSELYCKGFTDIGGSMTFGSETQISNNTVSQASLVYDSASSKFVASFIETGDSGKIKTNAIGLSGTSASAASSQAVSGVTSSSTYLSAVYTTGGKVVLAFRDSSNSSYGSTVVATYNSSSNSYTYGSVQVFNAANSQYPSIGYDSNLNRVAIFYKDGGNSGLASLKHASVGTNSLTFQSNAAKVLSSAGDTVDRKSERLPFSGINMGNGYDDNKILVPWVNTNPQGRVNVANLGSSSTSLTATNYIGIADAAYSDGATATVQTQGAIDDAQSSMTIGAKQYVQGDGTIAGTADTPSVEAGLALSATKLLVKG